MIISPTRCALIAVLNLATTLVSVTASPAPAATSPYASTTTGVMKSIGCYSSSGDLTNAGASEWQTSGLCQGTCLALGKPVLGLNQGGDCWCGDLLPAADTLVNTKLCNITCFGYGEPCGGTNTWTVWLTGEAASVGSLDDSTSGVASSVAAISSSSPSSTVAGSGSSIKIIATSSAAATVASTSIASTTAAASSVEQPTTSAVPTTIVATVTVGGSVQTVVATTIIASLSSTASSSALASTVNKSSGSSKVGIAVGVVVGILALAGLIGGLLYYYKRKNARRGSGSEKGHARASSMQDFRNFAIPRLPNLGPENRVSTLNDSRLDPRTMVEKRQSQVSMLDNVDYSRKILKVTNPDG